MHPVSGPYLNDAGKILLFSVILMGILHTIMAFWLLGTRIWALSQARISPEKAKDSSLLANLPAWARNPAANYNNLCEAPPLFYATVGVIVFLDLADTAYAALSLSYVLLRLGHSLVQATFNRIALRVLLFALSWIVLGAMILRAALSFFV